MPMRKPPKPKKCWFLYMFITVVSPVGELVSVTYGSSSFHRTYKSFETTLHFQYSIRREFLSSIRTQFPCIARGGIGGGTDRG